MLKLTNCDGYISDDTSTMAAAQAPLQSPAETAERPLEPPVPARRGRIDRSARREKGRRVPQTPPNGTLREAARFHSPGPPGPNIEDWPKH